MRGKSGLRGTKRITDGREHNVAEGEDVGGRERREGEGEERVTLMYA